MRNRILKAQTTLWMAVLALGLSAGWLLSSGSVPSRQLTLAADAASRKPSGSAQLLSIQGLNETSQAMCEWIPASSASVLPAAWQQGSQTAADVAAQREEIRRRAPLRVIKDQYAAFSAVAVDPVRDEVVLSDESLLQIMVYDRLTNTPPQAAMSEPKRIIGGLDTKVDYICGLYIDPPSGDIYAINNDTVDTMVIFNRDAEGNTPPTRELYTPHGTYGIAVHEEDEELFFTIQHDSAVVAFNKSAEKDDPPLRYIQGESTKLADPHGIALDQERGLMFVANFGSVHYHDPEVDNPSRPMYSRGEGKPNWPLTRNAAIPGSGRFYPPSITVYDKNASGNTAPLRTIQGPNANLDWPTGLAYDSVENELFVTNDMRDEVAVFDGDADGNVAPKRTLRGPKTMIKNPTGVWVDRDNNELWVASFGNYSATVFPLDASGDVAPKRVIRSGPLGRTALMIGNPHPVAYDSKREQILVPN
jgi:DNA-binding beta-propeller fold protein YncE